MADFDGMDPSFSQKQTDQQAFVSQLNSWVRRTRQMCAAADRVNTDHPTMYADLIAAATAGQEAKLRAIWVILKDFAAADPQTDPIPDLPAP